MHELTETRSFVAEEWTDPHSDRSPKKYRGEELARLAIVECRLLLLRSTAFGVLEVRDGPRV
jgi:hypothetical protein